MTAVEKMAATYLIPFALLLTLALMVAAHQLGNKIKRGFLHQQQVEEGVVDVSGADEQQQDEVVGIDNNNNNNNNEDDEIEPAMVDDDFILLSSEKEHETDTQAEDTWNARYGATFMGLLLLMYEGVTSGTLDLLHCVSFGDELRLYRAGEIRCYTRWQIPLFLLLGMAIVPFPLLLVFIRRIIRRRRLEGMSVGQAVLRVLEMPYSSDCRWWESVGLFCRLALATLGMLIVDPVWRAVSLFAGCSVVLASHLHYQPFRDRTYGRVESGFLIGLVFVAVVQIVQGVYSHLGLLPEGMTADALEYLAIVLALLPVCFAALTLLHARGPQLWAWLRSGPCGRRESRSQGDARCGGTSAPAAAGSA